MLLRHLAFATGLAVAAAPVAAHAAPPAPAVVQTVKASPKPSTSDAARSYAQREAQDPKAGDFRGGDAVIVTISGGALLVLLLVLLIVV